MFEELTSKLTQQWQSLSDRDRKSAILLIIFTTLAIVIFLVIVPIQKFKSNAQEALTKAEATYTELVIMAPKALVNTQASPAFSTSSLNSEIRRQAARNGLTIQRFEPDGENLKIWLEEARYPAIVKWLAGLETLGITHTELVLDSKNKPGFVSVRVTFGLPKP